jgi:hypothetical protein
MNELEGYQRTYLRDYATECICDDMDDAIDFLNTRDDIGSSVSEKVHKLSDNDLVDAAVKYSGSESIDDILED